MQGKYPNRGYPKIFQDETYGKEAKKLFDQAQIELQKLISNNLIEARGIVSFFPAKSNGDDIQLFKDDQNRNNVLHTFHFLRQQSHQDQEQDEPYYCLSDFVSPNNNDYIGTFACGIFGCEAICKKLEKENDDFSSIMVKALCDRLAEAFAEELHQIVRKELWSYAMNENLTSDKLFKVEYQGIRPAFGYPSIPDHTETSIMWKISDIEKSIGISLTDSLAMNPASSVSGIYFSHPQAKYFSVGKIARDQVEDYANRKLISIQEAEKNLANNLGYDPPTSK